MITAKEALLWTDGRYYIQAEKQLSKDWKMMKMERGQTDLKTYIKENLPKNSTVALDTSFLSNESYESYKKVLTDFNLIHDKEELIDKIWENKPEYSKEKVIVHTLNYAGETTIEKYKRVITTLRKHVKDEKVAVIIIRLDDIACN